MSVSLRISSDEKKVQINIKGRFNYMVSQEFRDAFRKLSGHGIAYHVNLSDADYMDSSALGMLLLLHEHANSQDGAVIIEDPSEQIDKVLKVANFEQLFTIN